MKKGRIEYTSNSIKIKSNKIEILLCPFIIKRKQLNIDIIRRSDTFIEKLASAFDLCSFVIEQSQFVVFSGHFVQSVRKYPNIIKSIRKKVETIANTFLPNEFIIQAVSPYSLKSCLNRWNFKIKKLSQKYVQLIQKDEEKVSKLLEFTKLVVNKDAPKEVLEGIVEFENVKMSFTFVRNNKKLQAFGTIEISGTKISETARKEKIIFELLNQSSSINGGTVHISKSFLEKNPIRLFLGYGNKSIDKNSVINFVASISHIIKYTEEKVTIFSRKHVYNLIQPKHNSIKSKVEKREKKGDNEKSVLQITVKENISHKRKKTRLNADKQVKSQDTKKDKVIKMHLQNVNELRKLGWNVFENGSLVLERKKIRFEIK